MNRESVLSRQILTYMMLLTFTIIAISILGSWFFYSFILDHLPGGAAAGEDEQMTLGVDRDSNNNQSDIRGFFNDQTFLADTHPAKRGRIQPEKNFAGPTGCPGLLCQFQAGRDQSPGHGFQ